MPIYDYVCNDCNHAFEQLNSISNMNSGVCTKCESTNTSKQLSAPSVNCEGCPGHDIKFSKKSKREIKAMTKALGL